MNGVYRVADLQHDTPPYVPAFFMAAQQLVKLARITEAREALPGELKKHVNKAMLTRQAR